MGAKTPPPLASALLCKGTRRILVQCIGALDIGKFPTNVPFLLSLSERGSPFFGSRFALVIRWFKYLERTYVEDVGKLTVPAMILKSLRGAAFLPRALLRPVPPLNIVGC